MFHHSVRERDVFILFPCNREFSYHERFSGGGSENRRWTRFLVSYGSREIPRKPQGKWDSGTFESIQGVNHEGAFVFETVESAANRLNTHLPPLTHILYSYRRDNFLSLTSNGFHQNAKGKAYDARFDPNIELAMEEGQTALLS